MSIVTERDRLKVIQDTISVGTKNVKGFRTVPRKLNDADLPCIVNLADNATFTRVAAGLFAVSRPYRMLLFIGKWSDSTEGAMEALAETYLAPVREAFQSRPLLDHQGIGLATIVGTQLQSDASIKVSNYPLNDPASPLYVAVEFRLLVNSYHAVPVAAS